MWVLAKERRNRSDSTEGRIGGPPDQKGGADSWYLVGANRTPLKSVDRSIDPSKMKLSKGSPVPDISKLPVPLTESDSRQVKNVAKSTLFTTVESTTVAPRQRPKEQNSATTSGIAPPVQTSIAPRRRPQASANTTDSTAQQKAQALSQQQQLLQQQQQQQQQMHQQQDTQQQQQQAGVPKSQYMMMQQQQQQKPTQQPGESSDVDQFNLLLQERLQVSGDPRTATRTANTGVTRSACYFWFSKDLQNREPGDDPMLKHTTSFFLCEYDNKLKGEIVVQKRHQEHMAEQQRQQIEIALRRDDQPQLPEEIARMDEESVETYIKALETGTTMNNKIRIMVVGHFNVGKTTLVKRLFGQFESQDDTKPTDGIETHVRQCRINTDDDNVEWKPLTDGNQILWRHVLSQGSQSTALDDTSVEKTEPTSVEKGDQNDAARLSHSDEETKLIVQEDEFSLLPEAEDTQVQEQQKTNQQQYVMELVRNTPKDQEDNINKTHISVWDFAGQYSFYNTHQVFFTRRAVYLIVTNMSKDLYEEVDDACCEDSTGARKLRVIDFVRFWLNSVHEFCPSENEREPPVVLVGTFADEYAKKQKVDKTKYQEKKEQLKSKYFSKMRKQLCNDEAKNHISKHFMIDNMCTLDDDRQFEELRNEILKISKRQSYFGVPIPTKFFLLEEALNKKRKDGIKILKKEDFSNCNEELPFKLDEKEIDLFLRLYHDLGSFIYFGDYNLKDNILLEPQWLIDAFKKLITTKEFVPNDVTEIYEKWLQFDEKAILTKDLIDLSWKDIKMPERTLLLEYMKKLGLIVPNEKEQDSYFAPCVLKQAPPEYLLKLGKDKDCACSFSADGRSFTSKLCYTTKSKFIPTAVFNRLLAECISRWGIFREKKENGEEHMHIYCGCGLFKLPDAQTLYVLFRDNVVQIWIVIWDDISPSKGTCTEVKKHMDNFFDSVFKNGDIELHFKCPTGSPWTDTMHSLDELEENKSVFCDVHRCKLTSVSLKEFWISDNTSDEDEGDTDDTDTEEPWANFALSQEHKISASVWKAKAAALESVCRISYKRSCGTGFRVGSRYIMTAAHVMKGIYEKGEKLIPKQTKEDVLKETFAEFNYFKNDGPKTIFKFKGCVFSDDILDVAVLELKNHPSENVPMPDVFTKFAEADREYKFHFIGHSDGQAMAVDENIQIEKRGEIMKKFCPTVTEKCKHLKMDSKWPETVRKKYRARQAHYFHTSFVQGASGSPGVVFPDDGCAFVVTMLTSGYPQWYYDPDKAHMKSHWDPKYCIEEGVNMKEVHKKLEIENKELCQEIFT